MRRLNREKPVENSSYSFGGIEVNFLSMEVMRDGVPVPVTPQELKMLRFFLVNQGRVISDDELLREVWSHRPLSGSRTVPLTSCVSAKSSRRIPVSRCTSELFTVQDTNF